MNGPKLQERGRKDYHPKENIEESIRGVEYDFYYTGKRLGSGSQIELHITSIITDWEENVFLRKSWYSGEKQSWRSCLREHVRQHLEDLAVGSMMIMSVMRDFEVEKGTFKDWNAYDPVYYKSK